MPLHYTPCCGTAWIFGVSAANTATVQEDLKVAIQNHRGLALLTMNTTEVEAGGKERAEKEGFEFLTKFHNPNSGRTVHLFGKKLSSKEPV